MSSVPTAMTTSALGPSADLPLLPDRIAAQLLASVRTGLVVVDASRVLYANPAAARMFGRLPSWMVGQGVGALIAPASRAVTLAQLQLRLAGVPGKPYDIRCVRGNGSEFDARIWGQPFVLDGRTVNLVNLTDISELKDAVRRAEWRSDMLAHSEALCRAGSFELRWPACDVVLSPGLRALVGESDEPDPADPVERVAAPPAAVGIAQLDWIPTDERALVADIWRNARVEEPFEFQHGVQCADGRHLLVLHRGVLHAPATPGADCVGVAILQDISARRDAERRIDELANFDEITGLANRANLLQQIEVAIASPQCEQPTFCLLSIGVPRIDELAGTMGFAAGDALAMALAARLSVICRREETLAHLGGSEYAVFIRPGSEGSTACSAAARARAVELQAALHGPVSLGAADIHARCHIGIARFPDDGVAANLLLAAAQSARLDAGSSDGVAFFKPQSNARALRELQLETALRNALSLGELWLAYQPQVCLHTGAIVGAEALLRWRSAECGPVGPDEFIPVAERCGLIAPIGDWVIRKACEQIAFWQKAGLAPIRLHVNISPVQFQLGDVAQTIRHALHETGAPASSLGVELTESALLHDGERVVATLRELQASGIEIALDDFGTGFSSLSRLRDLPIGLLKIDRSFVSDVTAAPESASVTRSIISLAHGLQIPVLAEGVETEGQLKMLAASGCDRIQGYLFSRPVPVDEMSAMLQAGRQLLTHMVPGPARVRTLLLVDDEESILSALKRLFRREGYRILTAASGAQALELLAGTEVDVIISDQRMPGMTGVDFLRRTKALHPHTIRMTLSGFTDLQSIIDAVNEGAVYKFLTKPWDDERLRDHVAQAFAQKEMADENRRLQGALSSVNADLATLNERLERLLDRQSERSRLMEVSANGVRELVDQLPAAVFGLDPDGVLSYLNKQAAELWPPALACLGRQPGPEIRCLIDRLGTAASRCDEDGLAVAFNQRRYLAWLTKLSADTADRGQLLVLVAAPESP